MILLSRLIKSQWPTSSSEKKVISIKMFNGYEQVNRDAIAKEDQIDPNELIEEAKLEADQIIQQAYREKETVLSQIKQDRETWENEKSLLIATAQEDGFKHGWEEGQRQGYLEYQEHVNTARQIIKTAKDDYLSYLEASEKTILDLSLNIVEKVVAKKMEENGEFFLALTKKAIREVKNYQDVQIHVHPNQYDFLLEKKNELLGVFSRDDTDLFIYPDCDLLEGCCIIESANGRIDASIDTQLSEIKQRLLEYLECES